MTASNETSETRTVSLELPSALLSRVDAFIASSASPFETIDAFVELAIVEQLVPGRGDSYTQSEIIPEKIVTKSTSRKTKSPSAPNAGSLRERTLLGRPPAIDPLLTGLAKVDTAALSGLHSRDYPSLWSATQLATLCVEGPIRWDRARKELVKRAWELGEFIGDARAEDGTKLDALFPTNHAKPQSAENAFRDFALGKISDRGTELSASGPLFTWGICQVALRDEKPAVGFTPQGLELLGALPNLSLQIPHSEDDARTFFTYLSRHAASDWRALMEVLRLAHASPTRAEVVATFHASQPTWSESQTSANVSGYVSRCREWGLVEPKQVKGRYFLTKLGEELLDAAVRSVVRA